MPWIVKTANLAEETESKTEKKLKAAAERIVNLRKELAEKQRAKIQEDNELLQKEAQKIEHLQVQLEEEERKYKEIAAELAEDLKYAPDTHRYHSPPVLENCFHLF